MSARELSAMEVSDLILGESLSNARLEADVLVIVGCLDACWKLFNLNAHQIFDIYGKRFSSQSLI